MLRRQAGKRTDLVAGAVRFARRWAISFPTSSMGRDIGFPWARSVWKAFRIQMLGASFGKKGDPLLLGRLFAAGFCRLLTKTESVGSISGGREATHFCGFIPSIRLTHLRQRHKMPRTSGRACQGRAFRTIASLRSWARAPRRNRRPGFPPAIFSILRGRRRAIWRSPTAR